MNVHRLKTWPEYFDAVVRGRKTFEVRNDDRNFKEGDTLILMEWSPVTRKYSGNEVAATVLYCLRDALWVKPGQVAMGICVLSDPSTAGIGGVMLDVQRESIDLRKQKAALEADRDQWKARAEAAERKLRELAELASEADNTWAGANDIETMRQLYAQRLAKLRDAVIAAAEGSGT